MAADRTSPHILQAGSVRSGGQTIHFQVLGEGAPLFLLGGGPGLSPEYMLPVMADLAKAHQCILIHQRGSGLSTVPISAETINLSLFLDDILKVAAELKHSSFSILGHSWGGLLAMELAVRYPNRIDKLLLIGAAGSNTDYIPLFMQNLFESLPPDDRHFYATAGAELMQLLAALDEQPVPDEIFRLHLRLYNLAMKGYFFDQSLAQSFHIGEQDLNLAVKDLMEKWLLDTRWNIRKRLKALDVPTILIQGRQDPMGLETALATSRAIPHSSLHIIERCGHLPWLEQPGEFYKLVGEFLRN